MQKKKYYLRVIIKEKKTKRKENKKRKGQITKIKGKREILKSVKINEQRS